MEYTCSWYSHCYSHIMVEPFFSDWYRHRRWQRLLHYPRVWDICGYESISTIECRQAGIVHAAASRQFSARRYVNISYDYEYFVPSELKKILMMTWFNNWIVALRYRALSWQGLELPVHCTRVENYLLCQHMTLGLDLEVLQMGAIMTASIPFDKSIYLSVVASILKIYRKLLPSTLLWYRSTRTDTKTTKSRVSKRKKLVQSSSFPCS